MDIYIIIKQLFPYLYHSQCLSNYYSFKLCCVKQVPEDSNSVTLLHFFELSNHIRKHSALFNIKLRTSKTSTFDVACRPDNPQWKRNQGNPPLSEKHPGTEFPVELRRPDRYYQSVQEMMTWQCVLHLWLHVARRGTLVIMGVARQIPRY
jgi:hypothetical protein